MVTADEFRSFADLHVMTRVNGELIRRLFPAYCVEDLVTDPTAVSVFAGRVLVAGSPVTINGQIPQQARPAPELGQHTEEVMLELGYSWDEIAAMRETGAIL
jgi:crotonobetainyl-CoA:carnitine CoA-transferase CaiB-like acyl-CoA transferase